MFSTLIFLTNASIESYNGLLLINVSRACDAKLFAGFEYCLLETGIYPKSN